MFCFLKEVSECECCWEHVGSWKAKCIMVGKQKKKVWKFSRAMLEFCQAKQVEGSDGWCLIEPRQPGLLNQGGLIKRKRNHRPSKSSYQSWLEWTNPRGYTSPILDGRQFLHQPLAIGSFWVGFKKNLFLKKISNLFYKPTNPILRHAIL
jgi:hypothetical protein